MRYLCARVQHIRRLGPRGEPPPLHEISNKSTSHHRGALTLLARVLVLPTLTVRKPRWRKTPLLSHLSGFCLSTVSANPYVRRIP